MPAFKDWGNFLCNGENKTSPISFLANYYKKSEICEKLSIPLIITEGINTWKIEKEIVHNLFQCNHDEAVVVIIQRNGS